MSEVSDNTLEKLMKAFRKKTREQPAMKTISQLLQFLDSVYLTKKDARSFEMIKKWQQISRKTGESIREFWVRWEEGLDTAKEQDAVEQPGALMVKALTALKLEPQQNLNISLLRQTWNINHPTQDPTWEELRTWTFDIDDLKQADKGVSLDIMLTEEKEETDTEEK